MVVGAVVGVTVVVTDSPESTGTVEDILSDKINILALIHLSRL